MSNSNPMVDAYAAGQSLWLDYIQRSLLTGDLQALIKNDQVMGLTSNPAIFEQAIAKTDEYDSTIAAIGNDASIDNLEVFNRLAIEDIQGAADAFADTYKQTNAVDGYVSLEVTPDLAHDTAGTVAMGLYLNKRVDRPNLMIKVPGTKAGVAAFEELTAQGVNVNVTLLFSVQRYLEIAKAYIAGLERRHAAGHKIDNISSVASFFVSRVDTEVDTALDAKGTEAAKALKGKIAIANAKVAYGHFANLFGCDQFAKLRDQGARPQRLLWASTGTKNPDYSDVMYVEELIGPETVNTLPPKTMDAFRDHGVGSAKLANGLNVAHQQLSELNELGVSLTNITDDLETAGIASFAEAFDRLLQSIEDKRKRLAS
ncbi:UNVERIFIED_CONTAM: hypothetical protein GTU68_051240 [Idotea baltica]|nr:hypothetical protein [Idotea baltica]